MTDQPGDLGPMLVGWRMRNGRSQADLSGLLGVTQQTVSRWESGQSRPRSEQLASVRALLDAEAPSQQRIHPPPSSVRPLASTLSFSALSPDGFESFCAALIGTLEPTAHVRRRGVQGDLQDGIDIEVRPRDGDPWLATCKRVKQFGPRQVQELVAEVGSSERPVVLLLSRPATRAAQAALDSYAGWELWDEPTIVGHIRQLGVGDQVRLLRPYFPHSIEAFVGVATSRWLVEGEYFGGRMLTGGIQSLAPSMLGSNELRARVAKWAATKGSTLLLTGGAGSGKSRSLLEAYRFLKGEGRGAVFLEGSGVVTPHDIIQAPVGEVFVLVDDLHMLEVAEVVRAFGSDPRFRVIGTCNTTTSKQVRAELLSVGVEDVAVSEVPLLDEVALGQLIQARVPAPLPPHAGHRLSQLADGSPLTACILASLIAESGKPYLTSGADTQEAAVRHYLDSALRGLNAPDAGMRRALVALALAEPIRSLDSARWAFSEVGLDQYEARVALDALQAGGLVRKSREGMSISSATLQDFVLQESLTRIDWADMFRRLDPPHLGIALTSLARASWLAGTSSGLLRDGLGIAAARASHDRDAALAIIGGLEPASWVAPEPITDFIQGLVGSWTPQPKGELAFGVTRALRGALRDPEHSGRAADLLWALGRDLPGEPRQLPDHPLRALGDALEAAPAADIRAIEAILARVERWLGAHDVSDRTPFGALESVFGTDGSQVVGGVRTLTFYPYFVEPERVAEVRSLALGIVLDGLTDDRPLTSMAAAECLVNAFRGPGGIHGAVPPALLEDAWIELFRSELTMLARCLMGKPVVPAACDRIRQRFAWMARLESPLRVEVNRLLNALPMDLETRLTTALLHDWTPPSVHSKPDGADFEALDADWRQVRLNTIREWREAMLPDAAAQWLCTQVTTLSVRSGFARLAFDEWPELGQAVLAKAIEGEPIAALVADQAVAAEAQRSTNAAPQADELLLAHPEIRGAICEAVASALWVRHLHPDEDAFLRRSRDQLPALELARLIRILAHAPGLDRASRMAWVMQTPLDSKEVAEVVAYELTSPADPYSAVPPEAAASKVAELAGLDDIDSWAIGRLAERVAVTHPKVVAELLTARMRRFRELGADFEAVPRSWTHRHRLGISDPAAMSQFLEGIEGMAADSWHFRWSAPRAFAALISEPSPIALDVLFRWARSDSATRLPLAALLLQEMARPLIWAHGEWLAAFLNECDRAGVYDVAASTLLSGFSSGVRTGTPGEPFPQDVEDRDYAERVLEGLPYGSIERRFFASVKLSAEDSIEWSRRRGL